jgi:hypothetical protein
MSRRKKVVKATIKDLKSHEYVDMLCANHCGREVRVEKDTESVICSICSCLKAGPTDVMLRAAERAASKEDGGSKRPKGWHFMEEYVDTQGNVFHRGVEQPELRGTKEPTPIVEKPKLSKFERQKRREERKAKREVKLARRYKEIKKDKKVQEKSNEFFNGESDGTDIAATE